MMNALLRGQNEVPFLGLVQMFHAYHFFARKLALPRRSSVAAWERNGEEVSIYERRPELLELLSGIRAGFTQIFEAKMGFPPSKLSLKEPKDTLIAEKK
jgi:hypothetical protein